MIREKLLTIILSPHLSEKSVNGTDLKNEYSFHVATLATKSDIKDAVQELFNVKVAAVRVLRVKPKVKQFKGIKGLKKGWKKAYVTLETNQKIDIAAAN